MKSGVALMLYAIEALKTWHGSLPKPVTVFLVSDEEVERVVSFLKTHGEPDYLDEITEDDNAPFDPLDDEESSESGDVPPWRRCTG